MKCIKNKCIWEETLPWNSTGLVVNKLSMSQRHALAATTAAKSILGCINRSMACR